jgi:hypothetical protein
MTALEFRPKTRFIYPEDAISITRRVMAQTRRNNPARLQVEAREGCLIVHFPKETSEIWTPQMEVLMKPRPEGGVSVKAILGPRSSIWFLFRTALYVIAIMGALGLILGFVQWTLRLSPWGFYLAVAGLCAGLFVWFLSEEGKRRAYDEMGLLRAFMDDALESDHFVSRRKPATHQFQGRVA